MLQFGGNHFLNDRLEALALICESYLYGKIREYCTVYQIYDHFP